MTQRVEYPLDTDNPSAPRRFRSLLFGVGGDDFYGVMRADVLRRTPLNASYHHSDRTLMAEIALAGRFHQVPELLYFRRDHPDRAERAKPTKRARSANMDPIRADRLRHPTVRLLGEYVWGFVTAIGRTPLNRSDRLLCYRYLGEWLASRAVPGAAKRIEDQPHDPISPDLASIDAIVAGRDKRSA
jgi:hypothetical protein